ncbi:hypothetical protein [Pantanalinema sp. GBBB05]|uniref:hypothetical protein n=1 Tax=Pantanalinema sp. GBBB05 TaxID=2604139 RepID=UPI001DABE801|nr:hypothetical protein [Pantanalinema sp. GBBB05]
MIDKAINHTRLKWALAQAYVAKGLGVDAGKLLKLREQLAFDTHYTIESGNNGTRIYYSKVGILALAKMVGTPKADEFAAECVRSAGGALAPFTPSPIVHEAIGELITGNGGVPSRQDLGWNPAGQLANQEVYSRIPYVEPEPEYLEPYPVAQSTPISRFEPAPIYQQPASSKVSYTVNYTVNHHAQSRPVPAFQLPNTPQTQTFYWGTLCLLVACLLMPIALIGMAYRPTPQTTIYLGR